MKALFLPAVSLNVFAYARPCYFRHIIQSTQEPCPARDRLVIQLFRRPASGRY